MSLRRRFILVLTLFSVGVVGLFGAITWIIASDALETELERRLLWTARSAGDMGFQGRLALNLVPGEEEGLLWTGYHEKLVLMTESAADAFLFDARYNTLLVGADSLPIGTSLHGLDSYSPEIRIALREGEATTAEFTLDGRPYKYGFRKLEDTPAILAILVPADFYAPLGRLANWLLAGSVVAVLVAVFLGRLLAAGIASPLERLSRAALRIQRGRMDERVEAMREDEIGRLSRAMERMRLGILERDEQLRLMLAQVAHEIRNPLGGLELFASAAAETDEAAERRRLLARVRLEVAALNRIIDDFLTFARPLPEEVNAVDVREPVEAAAELVGPQIERGGGSLEVRLCQDPLVVVADSAQIKRAVLNLLRNASQAGDRVLLETFRHGTEIGIAVTDDGPGIAPDLRPRIFEPFVTDKEKGAGLGLAIVKKVVESLGGRVAVEEADPEAGFGKGARFALYFAGLEEPPPALRDAGTSGAERSPEVQLSAGPARP